MSVVFSCPDCYGSGSLFGGQACPECNGSGRIPEPERDISAAIIAVGEPGCYVVPGHLSVSEMLMMLGAVVVEWSEGEWDGLTMPRHTWMQVTTADDGYGADQFYREVYEDEDGAEPYTLIACEGEWIAPWERERLEARKGVRPE